MLDWIGCPPLIVPFRIVVMVKSKHNMIDNNDMENKETAHNLDGDYHVQAEFGNPILHDQYAVDFTNQTMSKNIADPILPNHWKLIVPWTHTLFIAAFLLYSFVCLSWNTECIPFLFLKLWLLTFYCIPLQDAEGVLVANIGSYMGGVDLWQNEDENYDNFDPQSIHVKILEVVSISGTWHLGKLQLDFCYPDSDALDMFLNWYLGMITGGTFSGSKACTRSVNQDTAICCISCSN
ncbi:hypothetical protein G4B88_005857 [Cannabis sativa]|uniref:Diacylglycerol kinase accessory domain-containing protein n=1 Tax=Cannabis sativa TaxID=3483 RepID=A0A7J6IBM2_CANSA|nr:hypothetical protein G4B88_005857 [Cannabis sativa]